MVDDLLQHGAVRDELVEPLVEPHYDRLMGRPGLQLGQSAWDARGDRAGEHQELSRLPGPVHAGAPHRLAA
jgi:hypothetical protein